MLLGRSIVALAGTGVGNVLLTSVAHRYFPDRVALLTAVYAYILGVSTAVSAALAAPIAQYAGWRTSLAVWAVTSAAALVPWLVVLAQQRRLHREDAGLVSHAPTDVVTRLWGSCAALSITALFSSSAICTCAAFAWLPEILQDVAGSIPTEAGVLLAVTGVISVPGALIAPLLVPASATSAGWSPPKS